MGREIRRVPPNWKHPTDDLGRFIPLLDEDYETALRFWIENYQLWKAGKHPNQNKKYAYYWERDGGPPQPDGYRPKYDNDPTWYQVYETVSEGTPLTPPFETKKALIDYLVNEGDFWDGRWCEAAAQRFVEREWAPSGAIVNGKFYTSKNIPEL